MKTWKTPGNSSTPTKEVFTQPSLTIPGMTKSIKEMLQRVERGEEWLLNGLEYTDSEEVFPIAQDLTDFHENVINARNKVTKLIERAKLKQKLQTYQSASKEGGNPTDLSEPERALKTKGKEPEKGKTE